MHVLNAPWRIFTLVGLAAISSTQREWPDELGAARSEEQRAGWLARYISGYIDRSFKTAGNTSKDYQMENAIQFNGTTVPKPQGYQNSKAWTFDFVSPPSTLLSEKKTATTVLQAERRFWKFVQKLTTQLNIPKKDTLQPGWLDKLRAAHAKEQYKGWLDKFISYQKTKRLNAARNVSEDYKITNSGKFEASIVTKPQSYQDSKSWTFDPVSHVSPLSSQTKTTTSARHAQTKRVNVPVKYTFKSRWLNELEEARVRQQRQGWLGRFISYYKYKCIDAAGKLDQECQDQMKSTGNMEAPIVSKPQESKTWTFDPFSHQSAPVSESRTATTVRQAQGHVQIFTLIPARRFNIPLTDTLKVEWLDQLEGAGANEQHVGNVGWLDRVVNYRCNGAGNVTQDCQDEDVNNTVNYEATNFSEPQSNQSASTTWTFGPVLHTSNLLRESGSATTDIPILMKHPARAGWLDRFVACHKATRLNGTGNATEDCQYRMKNATKFEATIVPRPQGYEDSKNWTFESVSRLLTLIRESESASPLRRALGRILRAQSLPTRRLNMPLALSFKRFPSLLDHQLNEFYYEASATDYSHELEPPDEAIVTIDNPVEANLPSRKLSVNLLKDIMIRRAMERRRLPPTTSTNIPWNSSSEYY